MVEDEVYQPERGDFIWIDFTPQAGTEQGGTRPALVLSPRDFNIATGLAIVCPVVSASKDSRFEVAIPRGTLINGVVLSSQFRSIDWIARNARFYSKANEELMWEVVGRIEAILSIDC